MTALNRKHNRINRNSEVLSVGRSTCINDRRDACLMRYKTFRIMSQTWLRSAAGSLESIEMRSGGDC
jgi:hypothetical protein